MEPHELLARLAVTVRTDIAPAVGDGFARTQAFMAAVILDKLARQLERADAHAAAERVETAALVADLAALLGPHDLPELRAATVALGDGPVRAGLAEVVAAVHRARPELGDERTDAMLARIRTVLRARVDRELEVAS